MNNNENKESKKRIIFILVLLVVATLLIFLFPMIYKYIEKLDVPTVEKTETKNETEERVINEDIIETIHYPLMRNSAYSVKTYYSLDKFTVSNMSNSDILLNAFLDIYEGNMKTGSVGACTSVSKQFERKWIELRIKNILGKNVNYKLENFFVPEDSNSKYKGTWRYDSRTQYYIYDGVCNTQVTATKYYDLTDLIKIEYASKDSNDINVYYYVGFAKVSGKSYSIYSDADMKTEINNGTINSVEELNNIFKELDKKQFRKYKYTFKDTLCTYNEYCLYQGEWID